MQHIPKDGSKRLEEKLSDSCGGCLLVFRSAVEQINTLQPAEEPLSSVNQAAWAAKRIGIQPIRARKSYSRRCSQNRPEPQPIASRVGVATRSLVASDVAYQLLQLEDSCEATYLAALKTFTRLESCVLLCTTVTRESALGAAIVGKAARSRRSDEETPFSDAALTEAS